MQYAKRITHTYITPVRNTPSKQDFGQGTQCRRESSSAPSEVLVTPSGVRG